MASRLFARMLVFSTLAVDGSMTPCQVPYDVSQLQFLDVGGRSYGVVFVGGELFFDFRKEGF